MYIHGFLEFLVYCNIFLKVLDDMKYEENLIYFLYSTFSYLDTVASAVILTPMRRFHKCYLYFDTRMVNTEFAIAQKHSVYLHRLNLTPN